MIVDNNALLSNSQAVTAAAGSTNIYDTGKVGGVDLGSGQDLYVVMNCTVAMTDGSSDSTLAVALQTDEDVAFGSATTVRTLFTFPAVSVVGARYIAKLVPGDIAERYLRLYYTPASGNLSTGSFDAFIVTNVDTFKAYADK